MWMLWNCRSEDSTSWSNDTTDKWPIELQLCVSLSLFCWLSSPLASWFVSRSFVTYVTNQSHHCVTSLCDITVWHHRVTPLCDINVRHHCATPLCDITVRHHCVTPQCDITVWHHCVTTNIHTCINTINAILFNKTKVATSGYAAYIVQFTLL